MKGTGLAHGLRRAARSCYHNPVPRVSANGHRFAPAFATPFTTTTRRRADITFQEDDGSLGGTIDGGLFAARPIDEENYEPPSRQARSQQSEPDVPKVGNQATSPLKNLRVVPASPSYFTTTPRFIDDYIALNKLLSKYITLPTIEPIYAPRVAWKGLDDYRLDNDEPIRIAKWRRVEKVLRRLNYIHPEVMPEEVTLALKKFKKAHNPFERKAAPKTVDELGRGMGVGRRKTSSAVAWLVEGQGEVLINSKTLSEKFARIHDRENAIWPLKATERIDKYNVWALVKGGGVTGQAEALTLAVARALMVHEPGLKPVLRRAGCVTRDPRKVERKKPGKLKARKMPAWVKR